MRDPVTLDDLIEAVAERFPSARIEGSAGEVLGSGEQLESAIANLVENALQHGGEDVQVVIRGWAMGERTGVEVEDDGAGISPANQKHIFERFFTTGRNTGGTGLGLALVQAICRTHGGKVSVQSRPGRTKFRISLPRRPLTAD